MADNDFAEEIANMEHDESIRCWRCHRRLLKGDDLLIKNIEKKLRPLAGKTITCDKCGMESVVFFCAKNELSVHRYEILPPLWATLELAEFSCCDWAPEKREAMLEAIKRSYDDIQS